MHRVGITATDAITMLLHQIVLREDLPSDARIPNDETTPRCPSWTRGSERSDGTAEQLFEKVLASRKLRKA